MKILTIKDIPQDQLKSFIQKMDGNHGISCNDKSWVYNQKSTPNKLTLYCYLISQGILFVEDQKLKSIVDGYENLIDFISQYFRGMSIVNFTDLFFLDEINECFCQGKWHNVDESWLTDREDYLEILAKRKLLEKREASAYIVQINDNTVNYDYMYFFLKGEKYTSVICLGHRKVFWKALDYSYYQFKRDFHLENARVTFSEIPLNEFYSRFFDVISEDGKGIF
jgi:hypothetical protein